ncbi:MAG: tRNA epoxyqueuosine(34) reductase QueG [Opitutaceae bacterium]|nr:tRNA epoxyqueuosine(34) reductase QueG [Opitutaceae bacterium]
MDTRELKAQIEAVGFDEVRFAQVDDVPSGEFLQWLEDGWQADMNWLDRTAEKRLNPDLVLPGVKSLIMLGVSYWPGEGDPSTQRRWAKYSLYSDYHDTLLEGLKKVGKILEEKFDISSTDYRFYTDAGPVIERGWAAKAGMGWQGKNGMLISRKHGNWLLLASVLTTVELEPDPPLMKSSLRKMEGESSLGLNCGKCTSCLEACPTEAIPKPGLIDARRCISYHTIENKGVIPRGFRAAIGSRIFGCDICLDVCPWNRFAKKGRQLLLSSRYDVVPLTLLELLAMTQERFSEVFRKSPIKRTKIRGLLRNACIVAGNLNESQEWVQGVEGEQQLVLDQLLLLAGHELAMVRVHAVWAVFRLSGKEGFDLLKSARKGEVDSEVLAEYEWWESEALSGSMV